MGAIRLGGSEVAAALFLPLFFILTPISIFLLIKQWNNRLVVWGALSILVAGMSGFQIGLEKIAIPHWMNSGVSDASLAFLHIVSDILNIAVNTFPYYLILVFFLHYAGYSKAILSAILLVPVLLSFVFSGIFPTSQVNYPFILSWGIPYMLGTVALFGRVLFKERSSKKRHHAGIAIMFFIPETCLLLLQLDGTYIHFAINFLIFLPILCILSILLGLVLYVHNVFIHYQDKTILTKMQVGASLMQHAFKNAIAKNKLYALNIQRSLDKNHYSEVDRHLKSLLKTNDHLQMMVSKLSYLIRNSISAELVPFDIASVLDEVIEQFRHSSVIFEKRYSPLTMGIDRTLMAECFTNIISNAIEAMDGSGSITVIMEKVKRKVKITFADSGKGMDKEQLNNLFEPFYSTKLKSGQNFGLGMFHIRKIAESHRGKVQVASHVGKGTDVTLVLPLVQGG